MGDATDKANLETTLSTISEDVRNLTEQQRVGESKGRNLEDQLELQTEVIQEKKKPKVEPKNAQSMEVGKVKVERERAARNLGAVSTGPVNKGKLPADEPIASSWPTRHPGDRSLSYWDPQNRLCFEQYGGRYKIYNPYYEYYADRAKNNRPQMPTYKTEISPTNPNRPIRKPPGFEK